MGAQETKVDDGEEQGKKVMEKKMKDEQSLKIDWLERNILELRNRVDNLEQARKEQIRRKNMKKIKIRRWKWK